MSIQFNKLVEKFACTQLSHTYVKNVESNNCVKLFVIGALTLTNKVVNKWSNRLKQVNNKV